jgi:hypothetical protein
MSTQLQTGGLCGAQFSAKSWATLLRQQASMSQVVAQHGQESTIEMV